MKPILILVFALSVHIAGYTQISTIVIKNKLVIPENPIEEQIRITKTELSKVEFITSKLGQIEAYTILFKFYFNREKSLFTKTLHSDDLGEDIKKNMMTVASGTEFYLENVQIKTPKQKELVNKNYRFILTD